MEIHRFEKAWLGFALLLIVGLIATITYGAVGPGVAMISDSGGTIDSSALGEHEQFSDPGVRQVGENEYDVYVVAQQFIFRPGTNEPITLPADSTVTFHVASADVIHGFSITGTNVNTMAIPGQVSKITVEFDDPQTYGLVCHEYCGAAHHEMAGTIEVVPQSEFSIEGTDSGVADLTDEDADADGGEN
ncbi:cytochrome c oxidase subunit II [Salinirubellus salinus]|uniref:Cytochrome c oxidase subunit II n=1 Tax=Salinirubellus salinus TaxID=1364945 RepID=A0A9E7UAW9_9EURY|nr:cytochrome c oxidase subunit II [Salinirubellus salinus]UWM54229.1 cytochrome c oxidase subunit II [Salinirubellus salinus]